MTVAFTTPRTPGAVAAWKTLDFLLGRPDLFLREAPAVFPSVPWRHYVAHHHYLNLFAFLQQRDPSRQISAFAAAKAFGNTLYSISSDRWTETESIFRHPHHTAFDQFVLEHSLHDRPESPLWGDWDGAGRDNFSEFVLGTDPLVPDSQTSAEIRIVSNEVLASLSGAKTGSLTSLVCQVAEHPAGPWAASAEGLRGWQALANGELLPIYGGGNTISFPRRFIRFQPVLDSARWLDSNQDGVPHAYEHPGFGIPGVGGPADSPAMPDTRADTLVPGGAPKYLRYLTAAEIGRSNGFDASFRYHPLVAGNRYYIEILHKQGGGGEHCTVEWQVPGGGTRTLIPSANLGCLPVEQIGW